MSKAYTNLHPGSKSALDLNELNKYRELIFFFALREFKVRYKQTILGPLWAIFQPLILMIIFTVFFHKVAKVESPDPAIPYAVFAYIGLLFWVYFVNAVTFSSNSLVTNQQVITKVYFPRIIVPLSTTLVGLADVFFGTMILFGVIILYGVQIHLLGVILFLPLLFTTFLTSLSLGVLLSAINVQFRDVRFAVPFFIQSLLFITPVIYPVNLVGEAYRWLLFINPMAGIISTLRSTLLLGELPDKTYLLISSISLLVLLVISFTYFSRRERKFADIV